MVALAQEPRDADLRDADLIAPGNDPAYRQVAFGGSHGLLSLHVVEVMIWWRARQRSPCPRTRCGAARSAHSTPSYYSSCFGSLGEDALGAATTIVNAKVFDGTQPRDWTSVRFADGLITRCSVASAAQEGDEVIDAGGGTVLPGLVDAHVHLVPGALAQSLTFGVTTVLDMFSKPGLVARAKEEAGSRPDVADVRSSGVGATAPGGHRIWRGGIACDRHAFVASAAEAEQLDAFDARLAKVVAAVRRARRHDPGASRLSQRHHERAGGDRVQPARRPCRAGRR